MLSGSLDAFSLPDVLRFVCSQPAPGRLEVVRADVRGAVALDAGCIVDVTVDAERGPRDQSDALDAALRLLDGVGGEFAFRAGAPASRTVGLTPEDLLAAVERRRGEWTSITSALGSLDTALRLDPALADRGETVSLAPAEWRLAALLGSGRSTRLVAADSGSSVFAAATVLADLARRGVVGPAPVVRLDAPPEPPAVIRVEQPPPATDAELDEPVDAAEILRELGLGEEEPPTPPPAPKRRPAAAREGRMRFSG